MKLSSRTFKQQFKEWKIFKKNSSEEAKKWYRSRLVKLNPDDKDAIDKLKTSYENKKHEISNLFNLKTDALIRQKLLRKREVNKNLISLNRWKKVSLKNSPNQEDKEEILKKYDEKWNEQKEEVKYPWSWDDLRKNDPYPHVDISNLRIRAQKIWVRHLWMVLFLVIGVIFSTLSLDIFVKPLGLYNGGLRGVSQTVYYGIDHYHSTPMAYSYLIFFAMNVPFFAFGWYKVGRKFTMISLVVIILQYLFSMLLDETGARPYLDIFKLKTITNPDVMKIVAPFLGGFIGGIGYGVSIGFIYLSGGSTAGSKFVVTYMAEKKGVSIGHYAKLIAIYVVLQGLIVNKIIIDHETFVDTFISPTLAGTIIFIYISNKGLDTVFGKSEKVKVDIISDRYREIIKFLEVEYRYERPFSRKEILGGMKKKQWQELSFILPGMERKVFVDIIRQIDPESFVTVTSLESVEGSFYIRPFS